MVDVHVWGACGEIRGGSSPPIDIKKDSDICYCLFYIYGEGFNSLLCGFSGFCERVSCKATKLEYVRAKVCDCEAKQTACPRDSKIQDKSRHRHFWIFIRFPLTFALQFLYYFLHLYYLGLFQESLCNPQLHLHNLLNQILPFLC